MRPMLNIDLSGKRAFIAGVADDGGFGFAIAKALAQAGASICVGTLAAGARHLYQAARARQDRGIAAARETAARSPSSASTRSTPPSIRSPTRPPTSGEQALPRGRRLQRPGRRGAAAAGLRRAAPRHRGPQPRERVRKSRNRCSTPPARGYLDAVGVSAYSNDRRSCAISDR